MSLVSAEEIKNGIQEDCDVARFDKIYRQGCYVYGDAFEKAGLDGTGQGLWPLYPDIDRKYDEVGISRDIVSNQEIALSRVAFNDPDPRFPGLPEHISEVRRQFWLARWRGDPDLVLDETQTKPGSEGIDGGWAEENYRVLMDGDGFGEGYSQIGLIRGVSGYQRVSMQHVSPLNCAGDIHFRSPSRWRRVTFHKLMPVEQAEAIWGKDAVQDGNVLDIQEELRGKKRQVVRVFEHFNRGVGDSEPTEAIILGDINKDPIDVSKSILPRLPLSYYRHLEPPMSKHATGRIELQMPTQDAYNALQRYLFKLLKAPGSVYEIDITAYDPDDVARLESGDPVVILRRNRPMEGAGDKMAVNLPPTIGAAIMAMLGFYERQIGKDSNVNAIDQGMNPMENRTLGENQMVAQSGQQRSTWSIRQTIAYHQRTILTTLLFAKQWDRAPVLLPIRGIPVPFNVPGDPNSVIKPFLDQYSPCLINAQDLSDRDEANDKAMKVAQLQVLTPYIGSGIDPTWFITQLLEIGGYDVKKALMQTSPAPMMGVPGMPGQATGQGAPGVSPEEATV